MNYLLKDDMWCASVCEAFLYTVRVALAEVDVSTVAAASVTFLGHIHPRRLVFHSRSFHCRMSSSSERAIHGGWHSNGTTSITEAKLLPLPTKIKPSSSPKNVRNLMLPVSEIIIQGGWYSVGRASITDVGLLPVPKTIKPSMCATSQEPSLEAGFPSSGLHSQNHHHKIITFLSDSHPLRLVFHCWSINCINRGSQSITFTQDYQTIFVTIKNRDALAHL
ncbi:hypothetical protein C5167_023079 [Papaver somniferum]|uniref:Uncharacterized protein n=1 Tax=Papaver somniferum TaxID=3469 RepID=A0A4Y7JL60_PAPSO|nr:hypothetical protein C5167_023079 [Papaver somniferum]